MFKEEKSIYKSKTFWFNVLMVLTPLVPGSAEFISKNAQAVAAGLALVNMFLRKISKKDIKIK